MLKRFRPVVVGVVLTLSAVVATVGIASAADVVREVVVEGTQRIEAETVKSYLVIREGDLFDRQRINRSLKSLFATGLFADVTVRQQGDALVVTVVENPIINRIAFEGNRRVKDEDLEKEVTLRPRVIYTRSKVLADVKRILTVYRRSGRFAATVEPKVIQLPQNRVDLVFEIGEGEETGIQSIRFVGNRFFDDTDLRDVVRTRETRWFRFFSTDDRYDPDRLTLDRELLRRHYLNAGFADFRVKSAIAELAPDRKDFFVTFTVEEGERYAFGKIDVEVHLRDLDIATLREIIEINEGDWYDASAVDTTIEALNTKVGEFGYAFVEIRPRVNRDREKKIIDVTFEVSEGPRVFVERIDIIGNVRTVDEVIRREFRLVEGDAFNSAKLARSKQRIQNLGYFSKVEVDQVPGSAPDQTVVNVAVEEKSTGSLSLGAGYSTSSGVLGDIALTERNVLGRGYEAKAGLILAQRRSSVDLSFTDPWFLDREIAAGVDVFYINQDLQDTSSYDLGQAGFALRAGYPITEALRQDWKYTLRRTEVRNVDEEASRHIREAKGVAWLSSITHSMLYDKRDSRFNPSKGYFVRFSNEVAGLGGTKEFLRNKVGAGYYYPIRDEVVAAVTGDAGHMISLGNDIILPDRFFVGGDDLRGFESGGIGPRDITTSDSLGGEWMYTGTVQLTFPLGLPKELRLSGRVFTDFGSVGSLAASGPEIRDTGSLRVSSGAGLAWFSPFGPVAVDLGYPVVKEEYDETELVRVNFGARF